MRFYVRTRIKISHLVASLPTNRQQVVHVRTACPKLSTSLEQAVNNLLILSDLLQSGSNKSDTISSLYVCMAIKHIIVCLWKHHVNLYITAIKAFDP